MQQILWMLLQVLLVKWIILEVMPLISEWELQQR